MAGTRRWVRGIVIALAVVVSIAVVIRLVLDPVAAHYTRKALAESTVVRGDFSGVHVTLLPPGYEIRKLKLVPRGDPDWSRPSLYAERVQVALEPSQLLHPLAGVSEPLQGVAGGPEFLGDASQRAAGHRVFCN